MRTLSAILQAAALAAMLGTCPCGASACPPEAASDVDPDTDGDGLSDFQETHKYFTDPAKADSDGDGVSDGDWNERREYAYSVRTITQVLRPITPDILRDDYQDARVLDETEAYVELEVIAYPQNTVASAIVGDPDWRTRAAGMAEWTRPGPTANWDEPMRERLVAELKAAGIDAGVLSDKELVEKASTWLLKRAKYEDGFSTFCSAMVDGRVQIYPGLESVAQREAAKNNLSVERQWERELFAKGMFENGVRGSCTSSAIYMNGCLRALGIPTRIVLCIPIIDGTDSSEARMLGNIRNHVVRSTIEQGTANLGRGWSSHTYNEVFVGGRWRRLNYNALGQNILDAHYFGMMIHVATFSDWMDGNMASTWGVRELASAPPPLRDVFGGANPYSTLGITDRFGVHGTRENPAPAGEFIALTIDKAVWYADRPAGLEMSNVTDPETAGHVFVRVEEGRAEGGGGSQYNSFYRSVDKRFVLTAAGKVDVPLMAERGYWVEPSRGIRHFYLRIAPEQFSTMEAGVAYTLAAAGGGGDDIASAKWSVRPGVTITKPVGAGVAEVPSTITIKKAFWSDSSLDTARLLSDMGPVILIDVGDDKEFASFKRFCDATDRNFTLEAPGHPVIKASAAVGGINLAGEAHGVISVDEGSWKDIVLGVEYTLRPANSVPGHVWTIAEGVTCRRK